VPIALTLVIGLFIVLGHDGCRALQMLALALPLVVWSAWPLRSAWLHRLRTLSSWWLAMGVGAGCG
jgi:heptose-I-phosphate ethanolaminephosphotransferase